MSAMVLFKVLAFVPSLYRMLGNRPTATIHSDAFSQALMSAIMLRKVLSISSFARRLLDSKLDSVCLSSSGDGRTVT